MFRDIVRGEIMLDKKRIRLMIRMAAYEKKDAAEDLKISSYYKKDYVSLHVWLTAIWVTLGYGILIGMILFCNMERVLESLTIARLVLIMLGVLLGYLIVILAYCLYAGNFYKKKHNRAKQRAKKYYRDLSLLGKISMKEKE